MTPSFVYAGVWRRFAAIVIDNVVFILAGYLLGFIFGVAIAVVAPGPSGEEANAWFALLVGVLAIAVIPFCWVKYRATPGKMAMGIVVVDAESGRPITVGQAIGRYLGYFLSTIVLYLGFLWVIWDASKQGWHDKIARTVVVRAESVPREAFGGQA